MTTADYTWVLKVECISVIDYSIMTSDGGAEGISGLCEQLGMDPCADVSHVLSLFPSFLILNGVRCVSW